MIDVRQLTKRFNGRPVLNDLNLSVTASEVLGVIGPSGSGKTTLLKCINGLIHFDAGEVSVDGLVLRPALADWDEAAVQVRRLAGMVFQHLNLWPYRTVLQNLIEGPVHIQGMTVATASDAARLLAEQFGIADKLDRYPNELSGGQRQRAAIARAVIMHPKYLLLDEITSALDPVLAGEIVDALITLKDRGMGIIFVSHQIDFIRRKADHVCFLRQGHIWEEGPAADILTSPRTPELAAFIQSVRHGW